MSEKLIRSIHPEVKIIDESAGLVDYIASDESIDSYAEIISAKGWRFTRFAKNAPFVDSHNYWSIDKLLGKVLSSKLEGSKLVQRVQWAKDVDSPLARIGWQMTMGGFLKAVSVGFFPVRMVHQGHADWGKTVAAMGLTTEQAANVRRIYLEQEQIELSACIIGANPNALAKAHKEGAVKDADLAAIGMGDDDMEFIHLASKQLAKEDCDPLMRSMVAREMGRISARNEAQKYFKNEPDSPAPSAGKPAGADEAAARRAESRSAFLRNLWSLG